MRRIVPVLFALTLATGCATTRPEMPTAPIHAKELVQEGQASFYASRFNGRRMAGGEIYDEGKLVAAHRTLPFGTKVRVTNLANGKDVVVVIKDRGPSIRTRVIDVSGRAAKELGFTRQGVTRVRIEVIPG